MKILFALLAFFVGTVCLAAEPAAPRIVSLATGPHPKAQIVTYDAATGTLVFAYLKADDTKADSGNSIARFAPVAPDNAPGQPVSYPEVPDATLAAAILATQ